MLLLVEHNDEAGRTVVLEEQPAEIDTVLVEVQEEMQEETS